MKPELLDYLCCPETKQPLHLHAKECAGGEIISGKLVSKAAGKEYPIIKGIPRFVLSSEAVYNNYTTSFGFQWNHYNWLRDEDLLEFEVITDHRVEDFRNQSILDVGCGGGRIARFLSPHAKLYIGLDYSYAPERAAELCKSVPHAHFIQADVLNMPLRERASFDFVFSHGVLHHTPSTKACFAKLPNLVKPDGELYIAVFRKAFATLRLSDHLIRSVINKLPLRAQQRFCELLVHLQRLPAPSFWKRFFWFSMQKNPEVACFCNYDWYAPKYHNEHTAVEVMNWFADFGFKDIRYIDAWPYCPDKTKYRIPSVRNSFRLGQLVGVIGKKRRPTLNTIDPPTRLAA